MYASITDSDMIVLQSVESYLKTIGTAKNASPQEKLMVTQQARDYLYSNIVQRVPRLASYLLSVNIDEDVRAQGLFYSLSKHVMDPIFVDMLIQYMDSRTDLKESRGAVGSLLMKFASKYIEKSSNEKTVKEKEPTKTKKTEKTATTEPATAKTEGDKLHEIEHIWKAIRYLLGDISRFVLVRCVNLTETEALAVAACLAMNNEETIPELVASDLPITADILNLISNPTNVIKSALLMRNADYVKTSKNQQTFLDSLVRWVYEHLNQIPTQTCYQFLVSVYGSVKPDVSSYLIQIKDCGMAYSNLLAVAKLLINQK